MEQSWREAAAVIDAVTIWFVDASVEIEETCVAEELRSQPQRTARGCVRRIDT